MKINDTRKSAIDTFGKLATGTVFTTSSGSGDDDGYYMKTIFVSDINDLTCNAVCLKDGDMLYFNDDTSVFVINAELTIK